MSYVLNPPPFVTIPLIVAGLLLIWWDHRRTKQAGQPTPWMSRLTAYSHHPVAIATAAIILGIVVYASESWLVTGTVAALVVFAVLWNLRERPQVSRAVIVEGPAKSGDELAVLRSEVTALIRSTIYNIYISKADNLLAQAPDHQFSDTMTDAQEYADHKEAADSFVDDVTSAWRRTRFEDGLNFHLSQAQSEAELTVKTMPPEKRPPIDPLDFRLYAISVFKSRAAKVFLRKVKRETGDDFRQRLADFIKLHTRYES